MAPVHDIGLQRPLPSGFGTVFTDHMFLANYNRRLGWHDPRIVDRGPLPLDPAATVLHYGQAVFDGLKAFLGHDDILRTFRPEAHAERLNRSAERLCMPTLDKRFICASFDQLLERDRDWAPPAPAALYLRPTIVGTEPFLGVRSANEFVYFLIMSSVGDYYPNGFSPLRLLASDRFSRAAPGGLGSAKTPANYAASLLAAHQAQAEGFDQVLWLDAVHHRYLDEVGMMNIMVQIADEIITPPLSDTILAGVTRDSCLAIMRDWGLKVSERPIAIDEIIAAGNDGSLKEVWGTGTAAIVAPIGEIAFRDHRVTIGGGRIGPMTQRLYNAVRQLQYGLAPDARGWLRDVRAATATAP
ncbi:MAG TPA: branched-chain amino acid aminotransferase [Aliidongia sp.]|uniref:branched-chain amino acid aminotransferase n=1 Tax=Aliidongia sp. TaxID=1914230 RepID=UPI002DDC9756|nr:branched-chain amino acid aminotransferase [Aliidongia sp.]HEV2675651.1 branched-chain amino acid aminotransferase [Aliidongia sp.]